MVPINQISQVIKKLIPHLFFFPVHTYSHVKRGLKKQRKMSHLLRGKIYVKKSEQKQQIINRAFGGATNNTLPFSA